MVPGAFSILFLIFLSRGQSFWIFTYSFFFISKTFLTCSPITRFPVGNIESNQSILVSIFTMGLRPCSPIMSVFRDHIFCIIRDSTKPQVFWIHTGTNVALVTHT
jgi:hypothetical protein